MFAGKKCVAIESVNCMEKTIPDDLLRVHSPPMADWLETFMAVRLHVLVRFGMCNEIIDINIPNDKDVYCVTTATTHYAKGVAFAAIGNIQEAERQRDLFETSRKNVPISRLDFPNKCVDILAVDSAMLDGEIEYRRGNYKNAFKSLRKSNELEDKLVYSEPWGWMQPTRHAYAALLLEQGHIEEAAEVYGAVLGFNDTLIRACQHPNNVWTLQGYHECLIRLGKRSEAGLIEPQLKLCLEIADVSIKSSCFCRLNTDQSRNPFNGCCSK